MAISIFSKSISNTLDTI